MSKQHSTLSKKIVGLVAFDTVASTLLPVWTGLKLHMHRPWNTRTESKAHFSQCNSIGDETKQWWRSSVGLCIQSIIFHDSSIAGVAVLTCLSERGLKRPGTYYNYERTSKLYMLQGGQNVNPYCLSTICTTTCANKACLVIFECDTRCTVSTHVYNTALVSGRSGV